MRKALYVFAALAMVSVLLIGCEDGTYGNWSNNTTDYDNDEITGNVIDDGILDDDRTTIGTGTTVNITDNDTGIDWDINSTINDSRNISAPINWTLDDEDSSVNDSSTMVTYDTTSRNVEYYNDVSGFYAYPSDISSDREYPGVIIVNEDLTVNDESEMYAQRLASYGYRVLVINLSATVNEDDEDVDMETVAGRQRAVRNIDGAYDYLQERGSEFVALVACSSMISEFEAANAGGDDTIIAYSGDANLCMSASDEDLDEEFDNTLEFLNMSVG